MIHQWKTTTNKVFKFHLSNLVLNYCHFFIIIVNYKLASKVSKVKSRYRFEIEGPATFNLARYQLRYFRRVCYNEIIDKFLLIVMRKQPKILLIIAASEEREQANFSIHCVVSIDVKTSQTQLHVHSESEDICFH